MANLANDIHAFVDKPAVDEIHQYCRARYIWIMFPLVVCMMLQGAHIIICRTLHGKPINGEHKL